MRSSFTVHFIEKLSSRSFQIDIHPFLIDPQLPSGLGKHTTILDSLHCKERRMKRPVNPVSGSVVGYALTVLTFDCDQKNVNALERICRNIETLGKAVTCIDT